MGRQETYVAPLEAFQEGGGCSRSIGPLRSLTLQGLSKSVTDDVVIEACVLSSSAGGGLQELDICGCGESTAILAVSTIH